MGSGVEALAMTTRPSMDGPDYRRPDYRRLTIADIIADERRVLFDYLRFLSSVPHRARVLG